jgi:hypothetical protein
LTSEPVTVGRHRQTYSFRDDVSNEHLQLSLVDGHLIIKDGDANGRPSTNGTCVAWTTEVSYRDLIVWDSNRDTPVDGAATTEPSILTLAVTDSGDTTTAWQAMNLERESLKVLPNPDELLIILSQPLRAQHWKEPTSKYRSVLSFRLAKPGEIENAASDVIYIVAEAGTCEVEVVAETY